MGISDARKRANYKYDAKNLRQINIKLNVNTDPDIIAYLNSLDNVRGYIKALIRADIEAKGIIPDTSGVKPNLNIKKYEPVPKPRATYTTPTGTFEVLRVNGDDALVKGEDGKKIAVKLNEVEKYLGGQL